MKKLFKILFITFYVFISYPSDIFAQYDSGSRSSISLEHQNGTSEYVKKFELIRNFEGRLFSYKLVEDDEFQHNPFSAVSFYIETQVNSDNSRQLYIGSSDIRFVIQFVGDDYRFDQLKSCLLGFKTGLMNKIEIFLYTVQSQTEPKISFFRCFTNSSSGVLEGFQGFTPAQEEALEAFTQSEEERQEAFENAANAIRGLNQ